MRKNSFLTIGLYHTLVWAAVCFAVPVSSVSLCSCGLLQETGSHLANSKHETITLELPQWPEYLPELCGWQLELCNSKETKELNSDSLKIKVARNRPFCITAQPLIYDSQNRQSRFFKCAGAIYPYQVNAKNQTIKLSWTDGYAAALMKSLIKSGMQKGYSSEYIEEMLLEFNWNRLLEILKSKQDENPWLLNTQQILEGIANHNFSANKLKMPGTLSVALDFPVFSSYVPENKAIFEAENQNQFYVTIKKGQPQLFALTDGNFTRGVLISGTSVKNISLEFISLPIYIIGDI
ncbi:MAG: hypothetical protein J6X78_07810 [Treponema sp.]|nr:hypothetical protein [Treponema sp.]